ncbi:hypothetical protein [Paenibacillus sp. FSL H8-0283]|uniref:hypothetical protein n=1 Tax=Paenibacillus sp. FSL H8-0283 TaxID=2921383 RepID=UPI0032450282
MFELEYFFDDLFGEKEVAYRCLKKKAKTRDFKEKHNLSTVGQLLKVNDEGYEVYFVVNSGGYKDSDIDHINAVFIDLDCGRDVSKNYFSLEATREYKNEKLKEIDEFPLKPSYIVETRNGLHCYWLLEVGATTDQFKECQDRLIKHFNADTSVKRLCNLMRVPGTNWCKDLHNKFQIEIIRNTRTRYSIEDIIDQCPTGLNPQTNSEGGFGHSDKKKDGCVEVITVPKPLKHQQASTSHTTHNWQLIKMRNEQHLHERVNAAPVILNDNAEVYDYLKKQNLSNFLGLPSSSNFSCIFHADHNPSAKIYIDDKTGHQIYYCFSNNCPLHNDGQNIIQITERLTNYSTYTALGFLRRIYNVTYHETQWQKEHKGIIKRNLKFLDSPESKECYPEVFKRIRNYQKELADLNEFAKEHVVTENFATEDGTPIFFASNSFLSRELDKDVQSVSKILGLFTYLGLLIKVKDRELPEFLFKRAKHEAAKNKKHNTIQYYSIPSYDESVLDYATSKAKEFLEKGLTMKGFGRELILRTISVEEADRVYPKLEGKQLSEKSEQTSRLIENIVLETVGRKGWVTEKEILENEILKKQGLILRKVKMVLPEILDKYGLMKTRLNEKLKAVLGYEGDNNSYPFIIYRPQMLESAINSSVDGNTQELKRITNVIIPHFEVTKKPNVVV